MEQQYARGAANNKFLADVAWRISSDKYRQEAQGTGILCAASARDGTLGFDSPASHASPKHVCCLHLRQNVFAVYISAHLFLVVFLRDAVP